MPMWMLFVLIYAIIKGIREIFKKKALEENSVIEVLFVYSLLSLLMAIPQFPKAGGITGPQYAGTAFKAFAMFVAWLAGFYSIKKLPLSLIGVLDLSRVLFATLLGVVILGEQMTIYKSVGLVFVAAGLLFLKFNPLEIITKKKKDKENPIIDNELSAQNSLPGEKTPFYKTKPWFIFLAIICCIFNAISGLMDKILMKDMNSSQLFVWYTFFLVIYYGIYTVATRQKITKSVWKNKWVYLLAFALVVMDNFLFKANKMPGSEITVMTLIKQVTAIVTIIAGKLVFKEKNVLHKILCAAIIIAGIVIGIIPEF